MATWIASKFEKAGLLSIKYPPLFGDFTVLGKTRTFVLKKIIGCLNYEKKRTVD